MGEHGFGEVAVGIKQRQPLAGNEVLVDQVEQDGTLAGAGLADDVEVAAAFVGPEHNRIAQEVGANAKLLM